MRTRHDVISILDRMARLAGRLASLAILAACGSPAPNMIPAGQRLITGTISTDENPDIDGPATILVAGIYVADDCSAGGSAVGMAGSRVVCAIFGEPFMPGQLGGGTVAGPFVLLLPCDLTVNLVVQTPAVDGSEAAADLLAIVSFATGIAPGQMTTLLPREPGCGTTEPGTNLVDLGAFAVPYRSRLGGPQIIQIGGATGGKNPLAVIDTDGDGIPNLTDDDDDGDGIPDAVDPDEEGDGIADVDEVFQLSWLGPTAQ